MFLNTTLNIQNVSCMRDAFPFIVVKVVGARIWYVGAFPTCEEADEYAMKLNKEGDAAFVVHGAEI